MADLRAVGQEVLKHVSSGLMAEADRGPSVYTGGTHLLSAQTFHACFGAHIGRAT